MTTSPEGLHQERDRNEFAHQSTQNQTGQDALDPQLTWRLRRPLVQSGVIGKQLARAVLSRTQRLNNRLPLLASLIQRWSRMEHLQFQSSNNVDIHRLPDFDQTSDLSQLAAASASQSTAGDVVPAKEVLPIDQASKPSALAASLDSKATEPTIVPAKAKRRVDRQSQHSTLTPSPRDSTHQLTIVQAKGGRRVSSNVNQLTRYKRLSNRLPLLTELTQHWRSGSDIQSQPTPNVDIHRLPNFDQTSDLPGLAASSSSQITAKTAIPTKVVGRIHQASKLSVLATSIGSPVNEPTIVQAQVRRQIDRHSQQSTSASSPADSTNKLIVSGKGMKSVAAAISQLHTSSPPPGATKSSRFAPVITSKQTKPSRPITSPQSQLVDEQLHQHLQRPLVQPGMIGTHIARAIQSRTQRLSHRLPLLTELTQRQPSKLDSQPQPHSIVYVQPLQDFGQISDLTAQALSQRTQPTEQIVVQAKKVRRVINAVNQPIEGRSSLQADVTHAGSQIEILPDFNTTFATSEDYPGQASAVSPKTRPPSQLQRQSRNPAMLPTTKNAVKIITPKLRGASTLELREESQRAIVSPLAWGGSALPYKSMKSVKPIAAPGDVRGSIPEHKSSQSPVPVNPQLSGTLSGIQRSAERPVVTETRW